MAPTGREAAEIIERGVGRRGLLGAAAAMGAVAALGRSTQATAAPQSTNASAASGEFFRGVLQPGTGPILGKHYLSSRTEDVLWGYVPTVNASPVATVGSGETITIDALSHEGILEDQGRDPVGWFGEHGVARNRILDDAVDVAANYSRTPRSFDVDGPHVVTGPVASTRRRAG